jgi:hypothetical protein
MMWLARETQNSELGLPSRWKKRVRLKKNMLFRFLGNSLFPRLGSHICVLILLLLFNPNICYTQICMYKTCTLVYW